MERFTGYYGESFRSSDGRLLLQGVPEGSTYVVFSPEAVLSRGATKDAHQLYLDFRGKEPTAAALLDKRGLAAGAPNKK